MDGVPFLQLAQTLSGIDDEHSLRTSVSRSYYAAYHMAMSLAVHCGVVFPDKSTSHGHVVNCLRASGDSDAGRAAITLNSLRKDRNKADYDLDNANAGKQSNATLQFTRAVSIIDGIDACSKKPSMANVRAKIRAFARQERDLGVN